MKREIEISTLDTRYESYRMRNSYQEKQLLGSIIEKGIEEPLEGVDVGESHILLNGFKRYRCAKRLNESIVPYISLGNDEVCGIMNLLCIANNKTLSILEAAKFIDELINVRKMNVAEIAKELSRSKSWVNMRAGLIEKISPKIQDELFSGKFPAYSYMYTIPHFRRMKEVTEEQVESFIMAVSGKNLSVRTIEHLAHGYFRGPVSFRNEVQSGNIPFILRQIKELPPDPDGVCEFERILLQDLEYTQKYMMKVIGKSYDPQLTSRAFHCESALLTAGIISKLNQFTITIKDLYDRNGKA